MLKGLLGQESKSPIFFTLLLPAENMLHKGLVWRQEAGLCKGKSSWGGEGGAIAANKVAMVIGCCSQHLEPSSSGQEDQPKEGVPRRPRKTRLSHCCDAAPSLSRPLPGARVLAPE